MKINYLRISVTDRCNFRCIYCMPRNGIAKLTAQEILKFEEIEYFVRLCVNWGIKKVRITGGEPLVRKGVVTLIRMLSKINGIEEVSMTTNGFFLSEYVQELKQAGLKRVNISLDTLKNERFVKITGTDGLKKVLDGIEGAKKNNLYPVKINVVVIKGINDDEIIEFAKLSMNEPLIVRFIEYMPIINNYQYVANDIIKQIITEKLGELNYNEKNIELHQGPAEEFRIRNFCGTIGFINALSSPFCNKCNRLRLTSLGILKPCLVSNSEIDIKKVLKEKKDEEIKNLFELAVRNKPKERNPDFSTCQMSQIGG